MALGRLARVNYLVNLTGMVLPLLLLIVTLPIYIGALGNERYGVLSLVWLLLGYSGLFDLGLSRASENALAKATEGERGPILATALGTNLALGLVAAAIFLFAGRAALDRFVPMSADVQAELSVALVWVAALLPLALVNGVVTAALESREHFIASNVIGVSTVLLGQILSVVVAVLVSPSLAVVVPTAVLIRAGGILCGLLVVRSREARLRPSDFDVAVAKRLFGYGGWVSVSSIVSPLLVSLDQFIIGSRLGASAVAYYAVPMSLVTRAQTVAAALVRTLFPRLSRLGADEARALAGHATSTLAFGFAAICGPAILVVRSVIDHWIGVEFSTRAAPAAEILLLGAWINGVAFVPFSLIQAQNRPDLPAKLHLAELLPFVVILWLATSQFGLVGAAAAWTLRVSVDSVFMVTMARLGRAAVRSIGLSGLVMVGCYLVTLAARPSILTAWLLALLVGIALAAVAAYLVRTGERGETG